MVTIGIIDTLPMSPASDTTQSTVGAEAIITPPATMLPAAKRASHAAALTAVTKGMAPSMQRWFKTMNERQDKLDIMLQDVMQEVNSLADTAKRRVRQQKRLALQVDMEFVMTAYELDKQNTSELEKRLFDFTRSNNDKDAEIEELEERIAAKKRQKRDNQQSINGINEQLTALERSKMRHRKRLNELRQEIETTSGDADGASKRARIGY